MFNAWLEHNQDMAACSMVMKKRVRRRRVSEDEWGWLKMRDIVQDLFRGDKQKAEELVAKKIHQGQWKPDEDFPKDLEERFFWCKLKRKARLENSTEDITEARTEATLSSEQAAELGGSLLQQPPPIAGMAASMSSSLWAAASAQD
eukprot:13434-Alexandrium_andersonii.AAC.1